MFDIDLEIRDGIVSLSSYLQRATRTDGKHVTDDMAIYRYMPKDRFLDVVENRRIVLAHISLWDDPFQVEGRYRVSSPNVCLLKRVKSNIIF